MALGRTFTGTPGQPSVSSGGPLEIKADIDAIMTAINNVIIDMFGISITALGEADDTGKLLPYFSDLANNILSQSGSELIGYPDAIDNTIYKIIQRILSAGTGSIPPDNTVTEQKLTTDSVSTDKIQDDAVTDVKLDSTDGQIKSRVASIQGPLVPSDITGQAITVDIASGVSKFTLQIDTTVTGGPITINGTALLNVDTTAVEELSNETRFFEVINDGVNFILRPSGLKTFFGDGSDGTIPDLNVVTTAPNGGTVANLWDMNAGTVFTTGTLSSASDQVIFSIDFGKPTALSLPFWLWQARTGTSNKTIRLEYSSDGVNYSSAGQNLLGTTVSDLSISSSITSGYRYWRLVAASGGTDGYVSIQGVTINYLSGDTQTTKVWRILEPSILNGGAVIKQYTQYTLPVGYEHTVQNPCQGLVIYSQGNAVVNGVIDMSQKAGLAPNGNPIPMPIVPSYIRTAKTSSLLHFDNNITDANGRTWTNNGGATFDATNKKFGTHAISFNGTNQWIDTPASDDFSFSSEDFTIDCWVRFTTMGTTMTVLDATSASSINDTVYVSKTGANKFNVAVTTVLGGGLDKVISGITILSINTFYHIALCVKDGNLFFYLNGVLEGSLYNIGSLIKNINNLTIGRRGALGNEYFAGQIDEFRIVKGKAMYTANFTPPTSAYTYEATITDEIEAFKEMYQLTTVLQTLRGGYGGNGGYGGGYSGSTGRQASVGIGGAGRQNLGGFGGGGSGGNSQGSNYMGGIGGSIEYSELGGGVTSSMAIPAGSADNLGGINGSNGSGAKGGFRSTGGSYTWANGGKCYGGGGGGTGAVNDGAGQVAGGDGQYAGGFMLAICKGNFLNAGTIKSNGGNGGNGSSGVPTTGGGGGGGGGAGGGVISICHKGTYANTGTMQVNGGTGGTGGTGTSGETGGTGTSGSVGTINIQQL